MSELLPFYGFFFLEKSRKNKSLSRNPRSSREYRLHMNPDEIVRYIIYLYTAIENKRLNRRITTKNNKNCTTNVRKVLNRNPRSKTYMLTVGNLQVNPVQAFVKKRDTDIGSTSYRHTQRNCRAQGNCHGRTMRVVRVHGSVGWCILMLRIPKGNIIDSHSLML